jgi:fatty-acyl-CoA synthase
MFERVASPSWRSSVMAELRFGPKALRGTVPWLLRTRLRQIDSLLQVALKNAQDAPHDLAYEMENEHLTWSELANATSRVAHVLAAAGVKRGDVVALFAENSPFYIASVLGITRVGATAALVNTNLRGRPLAHAVEVSKAKVVLVSHTLESGLRACEELCQSLDRILTFDDNPYASLLANTSATPYPQAPVQAEDDFIYIYTSGTTGLPKPCRVSHARAILAGAGFGPLMYDFRPGDKLYCVLPLYHANGLLLGVSAAMLARVPMAMRRSFSASAFWDDVHRYKATAILYIGELCRYLVNSPPNPKELPNPVRVAVGNGLRPDIWPRFKARFGIENIREFYGATEAPGFIANISGREGSVWLRIVQYDVDLDQHLHDSRGFCIPCGDNEVGELLIRVPKMSAGGLEYRGYTDESATEKKLLRNVFKKGDQYFRSGDLLRRDTDGFYYFVDRIGDTFRWKGESRAGRRRSFGRIRPRPVLARRVGSTGLRPATLRARDERLGNDRDVQDSKERPEEGRRRSVVGRRSPLRSHQGRLRDTQRRTLARRERRASETLMPTMTAEEIKGFMKKFFPQARMPVEIEELRDGFLRIRVGVADRHVRPGGTVSGPALMTIADTAMYYLVLAMIGPVALALTTNLNMNFLRAPKLGDIIAETEMLKLGKRLAVGQVTIYSDGSDDPVAHATVTYSIPPDATRSAKPSG